jgi:predicted PurR-regulated permease PerM
MSEAVVPPTPPLAREGGVLPVSSGSTAPKALRPDTRKGKRTLFFAASAAIAALVIYTSREVMLPFVLALVIAYVLTPAVAWVERRRTPRAAAILVVYVIVLGSLYTFVRLAAPRVGQELRALRYELPMLATEFRDKWVPAVQSRLRDVGLVPRLAPPEQGAGVEGNRDTPAFIARPQPDGSMSIEIGSGVTITPMHNGYVLQGTRQPKNEPLDIDRAVTDAFGQSMAYVQHNALELARIGRDIVAGVSRAVFIFGITLMLAAYMMLTRERVFAFVRSMVRPSRREDFAALVERVDRGLSGVVRGQLIICLINGVLSAIGFAMFGLKYWPVLAIVATVFSLIPIFGSIASAVPAVALGLTQSFGTAFFVLIWILLIHQLEANVLNPKIMGDAAKIHPVLVIFSLLVGEHFFHTMGALLAVPTMSIAQSLFLHFRQVVDREDPEFMDEARARAAAPVPEIS